MFRILTRNAAFHLDELVLQLQLQILCHWLQRNTVTGQTTVCVLFWGLYSPMHAVVVLVTEGTVQIDFQESWVAKFCLLLLFQQISLLICRHVNSQGSTRKRCNDCSARELSFCCMFHILAVSHEKFDQNLTAILTSCVVCWTWNFLDIVCRSEGQG